MFSKDPDYVQISSKDVLKEGYLSKKSRHMKKWRSRWTVVTKTHLYTFENMKDYKNPTESINLSRQGQHATKIPGLEFGGENCI